MLHVKVYIIVIEVVKIELVVTSTIVFGLGVTIINMLNILFINNITICKDARKSDTFFSQLQSLQVYKWLEL